MAIRFTKVVKQTRLLDPTANFAEAVRTFEIRTDPLTDDQCRVYPNRDYRLPERDVWPVVEKSLRQVCPFCPEVVDRAMPKFPKELVPEGRVERGECIVAPNLAPYTTYGAVARLCNSHFIPLDGFSEPLLVNGFLACQSYLRRVLTYDPDFRYHSISWNYMPEAGGSMVHPHLQVDAEDRPMKHQWDLLRASKEYFARNSSNFWADLVAQEQADGERYIGRTGKVVWLAPFAPRALTECMAVFAETDSIVNMAEADLGDFAQGLCRILIYLKDRNYYGFNLGLFSGLPGEDYLWTSANIQARGYLPPLDSSDTCHLERLHNTPRSGVSPERVCAELTGYFK